MSIKHVKRSLLAVLVASFSLVAFADDAPVYDVDSYPPQFDGQTSDAGPMAQPAQPMQPPPPPMASSNSAPQPAPIVSDNSAPSDMPPQPMQQQAQMQSQPQAQPQAQPSYVPSNESLSLDQRVNKLENQLNNVMHTDSPAKVEDMQAQVQALRGQIDELNHQLQVLQTQQKSQYVDLDKRLAQKGASTSIVPSPSSEEASADTDSSTPAGAIKPKAKAKTKIAAADKTTEKTADSKSSIQTPALATAATQPNSAEEQQIYQTAYGQIKAKKYSDAAETLQKMLQKYPTGQFAANAHYWLGELYGLMNKNDMALVEFNNVVKNYPDSPKIADAQLKLGLLYAAEFKWPDAKTSFKKVIANYPGTASARLASEQLKQIKQTGH